MATTLNERQQHVAWCKERALEYVDAGDLQSAVASMLSDMGKRQDTEPPAVLGMLGMMEIGRGHEAVRRWVEGFN
jgi:hypothetical protein